MRASDVRALVRAELGVQPERLFLEFHETATAVGRWTERHLAWVAPGVPVLVTLVRPDAAAQIDEDIPLLALLAPWIDTRPETVTGAIHDFELGLRRRLDQRHQASALAALAADAKNGGGFDAPACYHDHSSVHVLTCEHIAGETLNEHGGATEALVQRVTAAWLRQAFSGSVVPYDFTAADVLIAGDRLVLTSALFEPHVSVERARFAAYLTAVAADDPNEAAAWIVEGTDLPARREEELRRQLRQAVPFREGEWSGDERFAEQVLVQWRVAHDAGWPLSPHHQHVYNGLYSVHRMSQVLAPDVDTVAAALDDERLRIGVSQAAGVFDPRQFNANLDRAIREMVELPHRLDALLSAAADGRLRTKLIVPDSDDTEQVRDRTVLLVTALVAFAALASVLRHLVPALGLSVDRIGAVLLLIVGGWLLIAAARL
jgi:predicted unusual protein kinase regulating ubiquinone biosynthesis (AarF/ABC1/UbiB family)